MSISKQQRKGHVGIITLLLYLLWKKKRQSKNAGEIDLVW